MEKARGGEGVTIFDHIFETDEMASKCRVLAKLTLEPGTSIGYHSHEDEEDTYYILSGNATVNLNGETRLLYPGEAAYLAPGGSHSIANDGQVPLEVISVIIKM
jgi:mannose-6-phosphate isomerase-like protein (cupin superfamily)